MTFKTRDIYMGSLSRDDMLAALRHGITACVFQAQYLSDENASNVVGDGGGIEDAPSRRRVIDALEAGFLLARMYDELAPDQEQADAEAR